MTDQANPRPQELADRMDHLMNGGAKQAAADPGRRVSTNPHDDAEYDDLED